MSHDEMSGTVIRKEPYTRKEQHEARYGRPKKKKVTPRPFKAADYIRQDWGPEDLIEKLERRAHGYNGNLRQLFCTAAALLRHQEKSLVEYRNMAISDMADDAAASPIVSKRAQQPGRLSGGEREALKKFVALVQADTFSDDTDNIMVAGRALLAKVRKRALGGVEEVVDASALMPVGVEDPPAEVPNELTAVTP